jgi:hypothetical protein
MALSALKHNFRDAFSWLVCHTEYWLVDKENARPKPGSQTEAGFIQARNLSSSSSFYRKIVAIFKKNLVLTCKIQDLKKHGINMLWFTIIAGSGGTKNARNAATLDA